MGTGILALPADVQTLGTAVGLGFLILNLPINLYAGTILGWVALFVEEKMLGHDVRKEVRMLRRKGSRTDKGRGSVRGRCSGRGADSHLDENGLGEFDYDNYEDREGGAMSSNPNGEKRQRKKKANETKKNKKGYSSVGKVDTAAGSEGPLSVVELPPSQHSANEDDNNSMHRAASGSGNDNNKRNNKKEYSSDQWNEDDYLDPDPTPHQHQHVDTATFDFIGITSMLFDHDPSHYQHDLHSYHEHRSDDGDNDNHNHNHNNHNEEHQPHFHHSITYQHPFTKLVLSIYYTNLFLVLGNYILVMSHAVSAMAGEDNLCLPTAGIIASTLMFALSQLRTMANLGRGVSAVSLMALLVVVLQCLHGLRGDDGGYYYDSNSNDQNQSSSSSSSSTSLYENTENTLAKMSSLASIGFAVGSQKLFLNIRHEMKDRTQAAPGSLSISLAMYGLAYVSVCLLAGPHPPSFLFDAIPSGMGRRVAGFMLWVHVAVSYAINSQAFCSSVDRIVGHRVKVGKLDERHRLRWGILTGCVAVASYLVANAIPFFKVRNLVCWINNDVKCRILLC